MTGTELSSIDPRIHRTADVSGKALIGRGTQIWHEAQIREGARIGENCIIGKGVYVDFDVLIGDRCKLQNGAYLFHGAILEDGIFLGPRAMLINDKNPRAVNVEHVSCDSRISPIGSSGLRAVAGALKANSDWQVSPTMVKEGASVGAGAIILPGVTVGRWAMVGAGAVVVHDVPDYGLVYGNPARLTAFVCPCGRKIVPGEAIGVVFNPDRENEGVLLPCPACGETISIAKSLGFGT